MFDDGIEINANRHLLTSTILSNALAASQYNTPIVPLSHEGTLVRKVLSMEAQEPIGGSDITAECSCTTDAN